PTYPSMVKLFDASSFTAEPLRIPKRMSMAQLPLQYISTKDCLWVWPQLPPELVVHVASFLPANEIACTIRLINKAAAAQFSSPKHKIVRFSEPIPPHAFSQLCDNPGALRTSTFKQRRQLLCLAARGGDLASLSVALTITGAGDILLAFSEALEAAASACQLEACQLLRQQGCPWGSALAAAAASNQLTACKWLLANGCPWSEEAVYAAARGGHVDIMDWLLQHRPQGFRLLGLLGAVAEGCDLQTLLRMHSLCQQADLGDFPSSRTLSAAASSRTPDWQAKVAWVEAQGVGKDATACVKAAACPDAVQRLGWLRQRGYSAACSMLACEAARRGNIDLLEDLLLLQQQDVRRWFRLHGDPEDSDDEPDPFEHDATRFNLPACEMSYTASVAAAEGHLRVLQWLYEHGCCRRMRARELCTVLCEAARGGHLHVVAWLVEVLGEEQLAKMRPPDWAAVCSQAASSGGLELLRWLQQHRGCRLGDEGCFVGAVEAGCEEVLEWLVQLGCPLPANGAVYVTAARAADLATLRCLRRLDCPWDPAGATHADCVRAGCLPAVLRWLAEEGCPVAYWGHRPAGQQEEEEEQEQAADAGQQQLARRRRQQQREVVLVSEEEWRQQQQQRQGGAAGAVLSGSCNLDLMVAAPGSPAAALAGIGEEARRFSGKCSMRRRGWLSDCLRRLADAVGRRQV
ncbi:hypothetical protein Agub_g7456, partial [Astrephomene gubernaculifera]